MSVPVSPSRSEVEGPDGRDAFTRQLSDVSGNAPQAHTNGSRRRTGKLYEVFTAYGAPIGRA